MRFNNIFLLFRKNKLLNSKNGVIIISEVAK
nr:MAG TPA: hypothetical protein [Caudoviricetes sp.]